MRPAGRLKLGFYPLPLEEAERIRRRLEFPGQFAAVDPCVGDGAAFSTIVQTGAQRWGIEIDSYRAEQAAQLGIEVVHGSAMDVRCPAESVSLLYLNPPYDFEVGQQGNKRLELVFLEHTYRWLKSKGVLVFVLPQKQLEACARLLAEHFVDCRIYRLTHPACIQYSQVVVLAVRRGRGTHVPDSAVEQTVAYLQECSLTAALPELTGSTENTYQVPSSEGTTLVHHGIPLDEVEDLLPGSGAYRQASRVLTRDTGAVRGRPLTPLHGGHVSLLATAGMLNGVFGIDGERHIAHWRSLKFVDHWEEKAPDGGVIKHDRERFSHELTLVYADGRTTILSHQKENATNNKEKQP
jgi:hypothetical protein